MLNVFYMEKKYNDNIVFFDKKKIY